MNKDRALRATLSPPQTPNSLALVAQSHFTPQPSNHAYVQEQNYFNYPQSQTTQPLLTYDSAQHNNIGSTDSYDNNDSMFYSNATYDEDEEEFNNLNQGIALIAKAFSKFSNKSNNRLRSSSNTRNQDVVNDGRLEVQNRNFGRSGFRGNMDSSSNGQRFNGNGSF